jgi:hypothetical protein
MRPQGYAGLSMTTDVMPQWEILSEAYTTTGRHPYWTSGLYRRGKAPPKQGLPVTDPHHSSVRLRCRSACSQTPQ